MKTDGFNIEKSEVEKYFRPSSLEILNNRDYKSIFYDSCLLKTPEDTILNYFSILREAANPQEGKKAGCGTIGYARKPYPVAYQFLSNSCQQKLNYEQYLKTFENILHINLIKLHRVPADKKDPNKLRYFVEIETIEGSDKEAAYFAYYYGYVYICKEDIQYKISAIQLRGENYLCAPYHGWDYMAEDIVDIRYGEWCSVVKTRYPTRQNKYVKKIYFKGTDDRDYLFIFFELTNGTDIEIAQYMKTVDGIWRLIRIDPEKCLEKSRQNNTIKLGVIAPLTSSEAGYGQSVKNGIDLAVENYNAQGGILGKQIETVVYDSKGVAEEAINAFENLVNNDKVQGVIGPVLSRTALPVAPLAAKYNIPMITPTANHPDITKGYKPVFRVGFATPYQGKGLAQFAYDRLNARKASIIYDSANIYSIELAEAFSDAFKGLGGMIVTYEGYTNGTEDFNTYLANVQESDADILFIPDYYRPTSLIASQAKDAGVDAILLGGDGWDGWETVENAAQIFDGSYFSSDYAVDDPTAVNRNFISAYRRKYNQNPDTSAALGYDSAVIMLEAIKRAGTTESNTVIERIEATNLQGVTGEIRFDRQHNPTKPIYMFRIEEGKNILIQKLRPTL